jgi:WD40 repeat protein
MAVTNDCKWLFTSSYNGGLKVFRILDFERGCQLVFNVGKIGLYVHSICSSPDNKWLFTSDSYEGRVKQWRICEETGVELAKDYGRVHTVIYSIGVSRDGKYLWTSDAKGIAKQFDIGNGGKWVTEMDTGLGEIKSIAL